MIQSITLFFDGTSRQVSLPESRYFSCDIPETDGEAWVEVRLHKPAQAFRNHDYTWVDFSSDRYAGELAPKILKLTDDSYLSANVARGTWFVEENGRRLVWHFKNALCQPMASFVGQHCEKEIDGASREGIQQPALIVSDSAVEFSRSAVPFSAVACFTDHCDYDTPATLRLQRALFSTTGIRVTKGFFLDHYSKREDNASFEHNADELIRWRDDGHELAYHALSQSIPDAPTALHRFQEFTPPLPDISTYIDHGYQPYNVSRYRNSGWHDQDYSKILHEKGIALLWNYIDCGTAASGIINQMNPDDFNVRTFFRATSAMDLKKRLQMLVRNGAFHHFGDKKTISAYMNVASQAKEAIRQRKSALLFGAAGSGVHLMKRATSLFANSKRPYQLAKYAPIVFSARIGSRKFQVFQSLEMTDFRTGLSENNLLKLVAESGLFIAHTYFAATFDYHHGRMIIDGSICPDVQRNFEHLGALIRRGDIWNPTVRELANHLIQFEKIRLHLDEANQIRVTIAGSLPYRTVR